MEWSNFLKAFNEYHDQALHKLQHVLVNKAYRVVIHGISPLGLGDSGAGIELL